MKDVLFDSEARTRLLAGFDTTADALVGTLGPRGKNVFIDDPITPKITNDGSTIANQISLPDKFENMGAWIVKNASSQTNDDAGDGTTTTAVMLKSIVHELIQRPEDATVLRSSINEALGPIIKKLKDRSKKITIKEAKQVALVSAEDEHLATIVHQVVEKVGPSGVVTVEDSRTTQTEWEVVGGYEAHVGFMSPYFITDPQRARAVLSNVSVFCTARRIGTVKDIEPLFTQLAEEGMRQLVVVCEDIDSQMLGIFVQNRLQGTFNILVIRAQGPLLEDIAAATGSSLISEQTGLGFDAIDVKKHLGLAEKVECYEKKTLFVATHPSAVQQGKRLRRLAEENPNMFEQKKLRERAAKLTGGIGVIRVGAYTDPDREYLKYKAEDAVRAVQSALEEGVVEGGGMTLWRIADDIKPKTPGEHVLKRALTASLRTICANAGLDYAEVVKNMPAGMGWDARKERYCDLIKEGIVDPTKVERCALSNAVSAAGIFLTTFAAVAEHVEPKENWK